MGVDALDEESDKLVMLLVRSIAKNVPQTVLLPGQRRLVAEEFVGFVGRLVAMVENTEPTTAKAAALVFFVGSLGLDKIADEGQAKLLLTLVETMKQVQVFRSKPEQN